MNKLHVLAIACATLASTTVAADPMMTPRWYVGTAYHAVTLDSDGAEADVGTLTFKGGAELHRFFAVEGRYGIGVQDDDVTVNGVSGTVEVDDYWGVYAKGLLPVHTNVTLYGLAGYADVEGTASGPGGSASDSENGFSYGIGADFKVHPNVSINAEWVSLVDDDDFDANGFGIGVNMKF